MSNDNTHKPTFPKLPGDERRPRTVLSDKMNGFSVAWRKGGDPEAYARNYDSIFRKAKPVEDPETLSPDVKETIVWPHPRPRYQGVRDTTREVRFDPATPGTDRSVCWVVDTTPEVPQP